MKQNLNLTSDLRDYFKTVVSLKMITDNLDDDFKKHISVMMRTYMYSFQAYVHRNVRYHNYIKRETVAKIFDEYFKYLQNRFFSGEEETTRSPYKED